MDYFQPKFLTRDLTRLQKIVSIDSPTKNAPGVLEVQKVLESWLKLLGFQTHFTPCQIKKFAPALIAEKKGQSSRYITFVCHADTVLGVSSNHYYREEGELIKGPGVADNKGGIVLGLNAVEQFLEQFSNHHHSLRFVISSNEEIGSQGFHHLFHQYAQDTDFALGLEPALDCGSIISQRSGNRWYKIVSQGHQDHCGRFKDIHLNAAHEISAKICSFHQLNDFLSGVKVNIGSLKAGTDHYNVICATAEAKLDTRFPCFQSRDRLHQQIEEIIFQSHYNCQFTNKENMTFYSIEDDCPPMPQKEEIVPYIKKYFQSISEPIKHRATGGAADVCHFSHQQNLALDGLGPIGGNLHRKDEYIEKISLAKRAQAMNALLTAIEETRKINSHTQEAAHDRSSYYEARKQHTGEITGDF